MSIHNLYCLGRWGSSDNLWEFDHMGNSFSHCVLTLLLFLCCPWLRVVPNLVQGLRCRHSPALLLKQLMLFVVLTSLSNCHRLRDLPYCMAFLKLWNLKISTLFFLSDKAKGFDHLLMIKYLDNYLLWLLLVGFSFVISLKMYLVLLCYSVHQDFLGTANLVMEAIIRSLLNVKRGGMILRIFL